MDQEQSRMITWRRIKEIGQLDIWGIVNKLTEKSPTRKITTAVVYCDKGESEIVALCFHKRAALDWIRLDARDWDWVDGATIEQLPYKSLDELKDIYTGKDDPQTSWVDIVPFARPITVVAERSLQEWDGL